MFALVDCNSFYASCEQVFRPDLLGKPVVVLSNNDGCVIARSGEAKQVGVPFGFPAFQLEQLFAQKKVHVFSANFALYGDMSARVMSVLSGYAQQMEVYSIDEAFMRFEGEGAQDLLGTMHAMKEAVFLQVGIPVSVGLGATKTLSKIANRCAKKNQKHEQVVWLHDPEEIQMHLKQLPVGDVWGIGHRRTEQLEAWGIKSAWDFACCDEQWLLKRMGVMAVRTQKELWGIEAIQLDEVRDKQSIATTRSFERPTTRVADVRERVATFAVVCAEKLRKQHSVCGALVVFVSSEHHRTHDSITLKLPCLTASGVELSVAAVRGLESLLKPGQVYRKAGVILLEIHSETSQQLDLYVESHPKHPKLMQAMDAINQRAGSQKIKLGSQDLNRTWKMKQAHRSQRYTTVIDEIMVVR